jgi:hypothetical protein
LIRKLSDSIWVKALVLFLLSADTVNTVFDVWFTYDYCVVRIHIDYDRDKAKLTDFDTAKIRRQSCDHERDLEYALLTCISIVDDTDINSNKVFNTGVYLDLDLVLVADSFGQHL